MLHQFLHSSSPSPPLDQSLPHPIPEKVTHAVRSLNIRPLWLYSSLSHTHCCVLVAAIFQVNLGYPVASLILLLHLFLDCTSFCIRPKLSMSSLTQSHQVFFGHPLSKSFNFNYVIQCSTKSFVYVQHVQTISTYSSWSSNWLVPILRVLRCSFFHSA